MSKLVSGALLGRDNGGNTCPEQMQMHVPEGVEKHFKQAKTYSERECPKSSNHLLHDTLHETKSIRQLRYFTDSEKEHVLVLCDMGHNICGHKGIVHGGFTASLIDNSLGALAFLNVSMPATKNLRIDYKRPLPAGQSVVVSSTIVSSDSKSLVLEASVYGSDNNIYAVGVAEFVDVSKKWKQNEMRGPSQEATN